MSDLDLAQPPPTARYTPRGLSAINPQALGVDFPATVAQPNEAIGPVVVVHVDGPLTNTPIGFDTYDLISRRFDEALASQPSAIVLAIGSPGGDVAGAFDCARSMRRRAAASGTQLVAHTTSECCSAAYALACAASRICCSDTAMVGSIGVIVQPVDATAADAAMGLRFEVISSGDRKADGNPHVPLSDAARASIAQTVDTMAEAFFTHVGESRSRLSAKSAKALQAGIRVGHDAVAAGLVDEVCSLDELLQSLTNEDLNG